MGLIERYFPTDYVEDVFSINYARLYEKGYRGIIFDIDNTLVPHGDDATEQVCRLFSEIHALGLNTVLLSNNSNERIKRFIRNIDTLYIYDARKPSPESYAQALTMLGITPREALVVGDQVFTDILGANRSGIESILVKYIGYYRKEKKGIRRNVERIILYLYKHRRPKRPRLDT